MASATESRIPEIEPRPPTMSRSNSTNSISEPRLRPKSRGSTTSLQSVGVGNSFVPHQRQHSIPVDQNAFMQHPPPGVYPSRQEEAALMHYQQHMAQMQQQHPHPMMDHHQVVMHHPDIRPMSQQGMHEMQHLAMPFPNGMSQYQMHPSHIQHMRHQSEQFEGSPAPEDSSNENGGAKRRKGTASSMANDQELKRLLTQHQGKTLREIALDVQKNEGAGGKSEKAKQVFAMLWLQESCRRSTNSVRRDRVFARYTERCGNERVPTLNPASFGKLVRIIFPNVQTRRLGVRGESKYHYVDLSLIPDDEQQSAPDQPDTAGSTATQRPGSSAGTGKASKTHDRSLSIGYVSESTGLETADFPIPMSIRPQPLAKKMLRNLAQEVDKMDCRNLNTQIIRISTRGMPQNLVSHLPALRGNLPATMATYLAMPSENSLSHASRSMEDSPIELPDIHEYLKGTTYDHHIAKLLHDLYRSYCIDVIDAFRKCKEKSFFNHHSAFNGKMTVPVSKLFTLECVAPWIQECDMRMYKEIVRFIAPLVQQTVPETVWNTLDRIRMKLVSHLVAAFEEKCPVHVVAAKVVPAARFTSLLKKLRGANEAAVRLSELLEKEPQSGTQMWLDVLSILDPERLLDDSNPPPESIEAVRGFLKHDLQAWTAPMDDPLVTRAEADPQSLFVDFMSENFGVEGLLDLEDSSFEPIHRLINWLGRLPGIFQGHHPQCMLDWHMRFWRSMMDQFGASGASGYRQWYYAESFMTQMLAYMTQMEGFLLDEAEQKLLDAKEREKRAQDEEISKHVAKRKREDNDIGGDDRTASRPNTANGEAPEQSAHDNFALPLNGADPAEDSDAEINELKRGGPLDLPAFRTGLSSPFKPSGKEVSNDESAPIDDSGIGLGLDDHDPDALEAEKEARKFNKRDWLLSSDPVDPGMANIGVTV